MSDQHQAPLLTRRRFFGLIAVTATGGAFFSAAEFRQMYRPWLLRAG